MTALGVHRLRYAAIVEQAPSRFSHAYAGWIVRADAWEGDVNV